VVVSDCVAMKKRGILGAGRHYPADAESTSIRVDQRSLFMPTALSLTVAAGKMSDGMQRDRRHDGTAFQACFARLVR